MRFLTFLALLLTSGAANARWPWTDPPFTPEMSNVLAKCHIQRSQVHYFKGPESVGYKIHLTPKQDKSGATKACLDKEITKRRLGENLTYVPPLPRKSR